jgi:CTP-dependent riboflavin kinase
MSPSNDYCAEEILSAVAALWARLPVPVDAVRVASRLGASVQSVAQRLAQLAEAGRVERVAVCPGLYRPAEVSRG